MALVSALPMVTREGATNAIDIRPVSADFSGDSPRNRLLDGGGKTKTRR